SGYSASSGNSSNNSNSNSNNNSNNNSNSNNNNNSNNNGSRSSSSSASSNRGGHNKDLAAVPDSRPVPTRGKNWGQRAVADRIRDVRFWHKADVPIVLTDVRFRG